MRIHIILHLMNILLLVSCSSNQNMRYINSNKLLQTYHGAQAQHELFQAKSRNWQQSIDSLSTELHLLNKSSLAIRTAKERQLLRYRNAIDLQAQQENQRLTRTVVEEINAYIKQYGKDKGYAFIFGATENGNIVYAAPSTDITEEVLKGLNEQYDRQHPRATP